MDLQDRHLGRSCHDIFAFLNDPLLPVEDFTIPRQEGFLIFINVLMYY